MYQLLKPMAELNHRQILDPTLNEGLVSDVWKRLLVRIEKTNAMKNLEEDDKQDNDDDEALKTPNPCRLIDRRLTGEEKAEGKRSKSRNYGNNIKRLIKTVCEAFLNPIYIPWDAEEYYLEHVKGKRDPKRIMFPNPNFGSFSDPLTVVDSKGRIVLWYLPRLLSSEQQSDIQRSTTSIAPLLKRSIKKGKVNKTSPNWRIHNKNFVNKTSSHRCEPGAVNFSSGWFGQGHETEQYKVLPSLNLRHAVYLGGPECIRISNEVERFMNLTLSLIHPALFQSGLYMLKMLRNLEDTKEVCRKWQSVYTGMSIISNRRTPGHRDTKGRPEWYDTLVNYSEIGTNPRLLMEDLGMDLDYSSGTIVGLCGTVFKHEVRSWGVGDRVCLAHFMRESVRKRLGAVAAGWVEQKIYLPNLGDCMDVD